MMRKAKINKKYRHFKGGEYVVLNIALDCDTLEEYVVYQSLQNKKAWVRKHCDFVSLVDKEKYPEEKNKYRFTEIKKNQET